MGKTITANARFFLSAGWLSIILLVAVFAQFIAPHDPLAQDLMLDKVPPMWVAGSESGYVLGTDSLGRDVLSRMIYGAQIALIVAVAAGSAAMVLGSALGLLAGFFGGWVDKIISRIVDIWISFPPVLFSILLVAVLGSGLHSVIIAIAIIDWTRFCRVIRSETMRQSRMEYVDSAKTLGMGKFSILLHEVLPNVLPAIVVLFSLEMGIAVIIEAILSFVNLSISSDDPTWGGMISEGRSIIYHAWWVLVFPMVVLFLTVLSFSQFGEALKEKYDPVLQ
ncbi:MAG: ABC transporter permease [Rhodospirillaceae bacterium]|nr:ABC transporter permease [Rhodospirillaceae bacterium]